MSHVLGHLALSAVLAKARRTVSVVLLPRPEGTAAAVASDAPVNPRSKIPLDSSSNPRGTCLETFDQQFSVLVELKPHSSISNHHLAVPQSELLDRKIGELTLRLGHLLRQYELQRRKQDLEPIVLDFERIEDQVIRLPLIHDPFPIPEIAPFVGQMVFSVPSGSLPG